MRLVYGIKARYERIVEKKRVYTHTRIYTNLTTNLIKGIKYEYITLVTYKLTYTQ